MSDLLTEYQDPTLEEEEAIQTRRAGRRTSRPHPRSAQALREAGIYEDRKPQPPKPAPELEEAPAIPEPIVDAQRDAHIYTPDEFTDTQKIGIANIVNKTLGATGMQGGYLTRDQFVQSSRRNQQVQKTGRAMIPSQGGQFDMAAVRQAYAQQPDQYGSQLIYAEQLGLPAHVLGNPEIRKEAEQTLRMRKTQEVLSRSELPQSMANWLGSYDNFQVAYDHIDQLTATYRAWNDLARELAPKREGTPLTWLQAGLSQLAHSFYEGNVADAEAGGLANPRGNPFIDAYNSLAKSIDEGDADMWKNLAEAIAPEPYLMPITAAGRFARDVISNSPYTLWGIAKSAAIFAAAGATGGLGALGATSTGVLFSTMQGAYEEAWIERGGAYAAARSRGATPEQARDIADRVFYQNAVLLAGPEALQNLLAFGGAGEWAKRSFPTASKWMSGVPKYVKATGKLGMAALSEAIEEGGQELITSYALGDKVDSGQLAWAMALGGVSGGIFHAGGTAVRRLSQKGLRGFFSSERQANEDQARERADELVDRLAATALTTRVPQKAEDFIEKTGDLGSDAVVYIDGGAILSTYQSAGMGTFGGAIEAAAQDLRLTDKEKAELKEAAETGGDVALPVSKIAVKAAQDADFYSGIRGDMKFDQLAYTDNELKDVDKEAVANLQSEMKQAMEDLRSQNAAVKNMHTKLTEAFKKVFWPEGVTKDGDMPEYFDAVAQLWAYNKVRQAEAQGVSVESMMGDIEVVNDGNTVKIVMRRNATPTTETQTADAQTETKVETTPTPEADETTATPEATPARDTSAKEADGYADTLLDSEGRLIHVTSQADWATSTVKGEKAIGDMLDVEFDEIRTNKGTPVFKFHKVFSIKEANRINKIFRRLFMDGEKLIQIPAKTTEGRDVTFVYAMRDLNGERVEDFYGIAGEGFPMERALKDEAEAREVSARERERQKLDIDEADVIASFEQGKPYEAKLADEKKQWAPVIDNFDKVHYGAQTLHRVMSSPLVFRLLGLEDIDIFMPTHAIYKAMRGNKKRKQRHEATGEAHKRGAHEHEISEEEMKRLPELLADPLMIFSSSSRTRGDRPNQKSIVVVVELQDIEGANIIVPINLEKAKGKYVVSSMLPKVKGDDNVIPDNGYFYKEISQGRLRYVDQTRGATTSLINKAHMDAKGTPFTSLPLDDEFRSLLNAPNVKQKSDLDKSRAQYNFEMFQGDNQSARGKSLFTAEETIIAVFERGDKSTLLHELGHVFLQELSEFAKLDGVAPEVREDWEKLSAWLGISDIDPSQPMNDGQKRRWTDAHEKFAAHFEAYLMEGVAPTEELKSVFRRFKEWLGRIYQAVRNIRWRDTKGVYHQVEMSDEVRGFFNRLFAAQETIEEQQTIGRIDERTEAMREAMRKAGASEEAVTAIDRKAAERLERAVERLTSDFMQDTTNEAQDDLNSLVNELLPGIREELREEPIYGAIDTMKMIPESRISRQAIADRYGEKMAASLDQDILTNEGGADPEAAAEAFGFASADEFVAALASAPPLEEVALMEAINTAAETIGHVTESDIGELADEALFGSEEAAEDALADSVVLRDPNAINERALGLFDDARRGRLSQQELDDILAASSELADAYAAIEDEAYAEENAQSAEADTEFWAFVKNMALEYWEIWAEHGQETADRIYHAISEMFPNPKERRKYITKSNKTAAERERLQRLGHDYSLDIENAREDVKSVGITDINELFDRIVSKSQQASRSSANTADRTQTTRRAQEIRSEVRALLEESGDKSDPEYVLSKKLAEAEAETKRAVQEAKAANDALKRKNDPNLKEIDRLKGEVAAARQDVRDAQRDAATAEQTARAHYAAVDKSADAAKAKLREVQGQLDALERKNKHDAERRERTIAKLREDIAEREKQIKNASKDKIKSQAETIRALRKERDSFQRKLNRQIQDAKNVDEKRAAVNKTIDDLRAMRKAVQKDVDDLNKQKHLLEREIQRMQEGMTRMTTEKEAASFRKETRDRLLAERGAMKEAARELFKMKSVIEATDVGKYTRTAEKFARKAESALRNGNLKAAAEFKRMEALNRFYAAEAAANRRTLARAKKYIGKLERQLKKDGTISKVAPNYADQIKAILERFSFVQRKDFEASDVESLRQFVDELRDAGELVSIPDWVIDMNRTRRYQDLTMSEFIDVHEALRNIAHLGSVSGKLLQAQSNLKIAEIANRLAEGMRNYYKKARKNEMNPALDEQLKLWERGVDAASNFFAMLETAESICRAIDGYQELGEAHQLIYQPVRDAVTKEAMELQRIHGMMNDIIERIYGKNRPSFNEYSVTLDISMREESKDGTITINDNKKWTLTRGGLIAAVLNLGNEGNKARMMDGWHLTEAECQLFLDAINKEDMDFVQAVWDLFESELWPMAAATHSVMTGSELRRVEATPVTTKHGTYRGGYYPIKVDMRYASIARRIKERQNMNVGMLLSEMYEYHKPQTKDTHRKARADKVTGAPPVLDIRVIDAHIGQVVHDSTMAPVVRDVHQILSTPELKQAISETLGDNRNLALNHWLRAVALDNKNDGKYLNAVDRLMNYTRVGMIVQGLGMNIAGGMMQYFGWLPLVNRVGIGRVLRGMFNSIFNRGEMRRIASEKSDFMKEQMLGTDRDVRKMAELWSVQKGGKLSAINNFFLAQYAFFQNSVNVPGWVEAYRHGLSLYQDEKKAVKYADSIIRTTQSAASIADLTQLETSGTLYRMFTMFYSWFRVMHNMNLETFRRVTNEEGWGHKTAVLANHLLFVLVLPRLAESMLKGGWKEKDDDDSWIKFMVKEGLWAIPGSITDSLPIVRDIANFTTGRSAYRFTPLAGPFESAYNMCKTYSEQFLEKDTVDYKKVLHSTLDTIGYWGHIPTRQGENIAIDIYDTIMGDREWYSTLYRIITNDRKKRSGK